MIPKPKTFYRHKSGTVHKVYRIANLHLGESKALVIHFCDGNVCATPLFKWQKQFNRYSEAKNNIPWTKEESDRFMELFYASTEIASIARIREANHKKGGVVRSDDACIIHFYKTLKCRI